MNRFVKKQLLVWWLVATAVSLLFWSISPPRAQAATITVNTAADELNGPTGNGACSLREAIQNANQDNGVQVDCMAGSGADTIIFDSSLDGSPITLSRTGPNENSNSTGDLDILSPITVNGNGANLTIIDGGGIDRIFDLPTAQSLTLNDVTVQNGNAPVGPQAHGGGIRNLQGSLTINATHITANTQSDPDSTTGGGGIFNTGTVSIINSTINDNYSIGGGGGGGIANTQNTAAATITNSTISGNRSNANGGGILNAGNASLTLTNVTITDNVANDDSSGPGGGGGLRHNGASTVTTAGNNIIAGNVARLSPTLDDCSASGNPVTTNGYNLRPSGTGCTAALNNATDITVAALGLGPLQDNGGPTPTHNLLVGSDAIDRIPATVNGCTTTVTADQRGVTRADGLATGTLCDVGAVEYVAPAAPSATNGGDGPGGVGVTDGSTSLELWLDADEGVYTNAGCSATAGNGNAVLCWADQSGNNVNATQGTGTPVFSTNVLNGQPVLTFDGISSQLQFNRVVQDDFTIISMFRTAQSTSVCGSAQWYCGVGVVDAEVGGIVPDFGTSLRLGQMMTGVGNPDTTIVSAGTFNDNAGHMSFSHRTGSTGAVEQYVDGILTGTATGTTTSLTAPPRITVGALQTDLGYFSGDIPEVIVFSDNLVTVDRLLVENYMSAKYDTAVAIDVYDGDTNGNGDFDLDVAGIGQFGGNQHTQAYSVGMIVRNRTFLQDDGDWLLFGHHNITNTNTTDDLTTTWSSPPDPRRWLRHWYVDVTDAPGTTGGMVDIIFDFGEGSMAGLLPSAPVGNYRLLSRSLDSGDFTDIATATAVVGDQVQFLNVDVALLGSNFTLGTLDFTNSPTAVTLQQFTAVPSAIVPLLVAALTLLLGLVSLGVVIRKR